MKRLLSGILEFREVHLQAYQERFAQIKYGQAPDVIFITCSDNRVAPNWYLSTDPGELFVIRNMGNILPSYVKKLESGYCSECAGLEHALANFPIEHIVICGHSECTAMHAIATNVDQNKGPLGRWLRNSRLRLLEGEIQSDVQIKGDYFAGLSLINKLAQLNVAHQIKNLKSYPPVAERVANETLKIHGWYFDMSSAMIYSYKEEIAEFRLLGAEG